MGRYNTVPTLPSKLLEAISGQSGGRVVLVLGAGCSKEKPTDLPVASELSEECFRKLVANGILSECEVNNQNDLSAVADAVFMKKGSQQKLINQFPTDEFRHARPNEGYLIMVALLLEGKLSDTLTLNIDHAARAAMADLGARAEVTEVRGPSEHERISTCNFIYLHGDIDSPADEIILRTEVLEEAWRGSWGEVVTQRVLSGPVTVFVGLGTPTSVLVETTKHIRDAIGSSGVGVYVVDPLAYRESKFANALQVSCEDYIPMGWSEFMRALAWRVVEEQRAAVERKCDQLAMELEVETGDVAGLCNRLAAMGLLGLGRLRSAWMLHGDPYLPHKQGYFLGEFCNLVLAIRMVENESGLGAHFRRDGIVDFSDDSYTTSILVCSVDSWKTEAHVRTELSRLHPDMRHNGRTPSVALVAGVESGSDISTPTDIVAETNSNDLVTGASHLQIIAVSQLRATPRLVSEVIR